MRSFEDIIKLASLPEDTVSLCLDGAVLDEISVLQRDLDAVGPPTSLGDQTGARLREQLVAAAERMRDSQVDFKLRALPGPEWDRFYPTMPDRAEKEADEEWMPRLFPWVCEMVARTCYDPKGDAAQVAELAQSLHSTAWNKLSNSCWRLNRREVEVPNFVAGFDGTPRSAPTSLPPTAPESLPVDSAAESQAPPPATSTTTSGDSSEV